MTVAVQREKWSLQPAPRPRVLRLLAQRGSHPFRPMTYLMRHKPRAARGDSRHCPLMPVSRKLRSRTGRSIGGEILEIAELQLHPARGKFLCIRRKLLTQSFDL